MVIELLSRLARVRVTVGYATALLTVATTLLVLGPQTQDQVIRNASTNLHNLSHGHLATLLGSAFVPDAAGGPVLLWLPGLVCLLALAELLWRSGRLALVFVVGHIGATLLVAIGLTGALKLGWLPVSVSFARDVGMSYGAAAVLGALTAAIPARWRPAWIGWWVSVALGTAALCADFTDVGHATALLLGMLVATRLGRPARWTRVRYVLLGVSAVFGFVVLAHTGVSVLAGVGLGTLGAVAADRIARRRWARRSPLVALVPAQPALSR
ncbi:rhomboid-like protein [Mycobacterium sp. pUA109]|uniref:rhomboid-like protein n=1 Tax=Mycobacterium sp. pUA109 TaxID=3238982 RepID=UPI00351AFCFD